MFVLLRIFSLLAFFLICSCSLNENSPKFRSELANQGPIALSDNNPYIAGNILLSKEMESSPILKGFIERKGTPDAIDIKKIFFTPDQLTLYYLNDNEFYSLDQSSNNWLIRGPYRITSEMLSSLKNLPILEGSAPLLNIASNSLAETTSTLPPANQFPELKLAKPQENNPKVNSQRASLKKDIKPEKSSKKNSGLLLKEDTELSPAEESISGDVIHRVTFIGQDIKTIAKWYTGDINNSGRIARINGLDVQSKLPLNQNIRIPRYLVKTSKPLPEKEINK